MRRGKRSGEKREMEMKKIFLNGNCPKSVIYFSAWTSPRTSLEPQINILASSKMSNKTVYNVSPVSYTGRI